MAASWRPHVATSGGSSPPLHGAVSWRFHGNFMAISWQFHGGFTSGGRLASSSHSLRTLPSKETPAGWPPATIWS